MPRYRDSWVLIGVALILPAAGARGDEAIPVTMVKAIKDATVYIKTESPVMRATGSGFVIKVEAGSAYIVTNDHVVRVPKRLGPVKPTLSAVFRSGTKGERTLGAELVATDPSRDLAVLKVTSMNDLPKPLDLSKPAELVETLGVVIFGFPFGASLAVGKGNPAITVSQGSISSVRRDDRDQIAGVQIDGSINPGNSGGPVVDSKGRLVGVAVAGMRGAHLGLAIPPGELTELLNGRVVEPFEVTTTGISDKLVGITVTAEVIDPLGRLKGASIRVIRADALKAKPAPNDKGEWGALAGARKVPIKLVDGQAVGVLSITPPVAAGNDAVYWLQASYVDAAGHPHFTEPGPYKINLKVVGTLAEAPPKRKIEGSLIANTEDDDPAPPIGGGQGGGGQTVIIVPRPGRSIGPSERSRQMLEDSRKRMDDMRSRMRGRIGRIR